MIKAIFFDFDGTLVEFPVRFMFDEMKRVIDKLGLEKVSEKEIEESFSDFDFFRCVRGKSKYSDVDFKTIFWNEYNWDDFPRCIPFPETVETLTRLKNMGFSLGITTARVTHPEELMDELKECGLDSFFDINLIATRSKPEDDWKDKSPQIKKLINYLSIKSEEAIIVGDIPSDVSSGKNCDLGYTIAVQSGGIKKEVLEASEPDAVLLHLGDLPNFIIDLDF